MSGYTDHVAVKGAGAADLARGPQIILTFRREKRRRRRRSTTGDLRGYDTGEADPGAAGPTIVRRFTSRRDVREIVHTDGT